MLKLCCVVSIVAAYDCWCGRVCSPVESVLWCDVVSCLIKIWISQQTETDCLLNFRIWVFLFGILADITECSVLPNWLWTVSAKAHLWNFIISLEIEQRHTYSTERETDNVTGRPCLVVFACPRGCLCGCRSVVLSVCHALHLSVCLFNCLLVCGCLSPQSY